MASLLKDSLVHWKKKLERTSDENAILTTIHKLSKVPITVDLLQDTGIGKIIRTLAKKPGKVGFKASSVLQDWRDVVASAQKLQTMSPTEEHTKHNSHKKEIYNGEKVHDKNRKQSSSSHEKHKKSKHSSVSSHRQKHINSDSEYTSVNDSFSTYIDKHATNLINPDCKKKEHKSTFDLNSGNHMNGDSDGNIFFDKESFGKASETQPLKNGVKKHKNEFAKTFNNTVSEETIKKEFSSSLCEKTIKKELSPIENDISNDRKRKYETSNGILPDKKKHKHEVVQSSVLHSSPVKSELISDANYKKKDKDKKSSKYNDQTLTLLSPQKDFNEIHKSEKSNAKKNKESKKKSGSKLKTNIKIEPTEAFTSSEVRFEDCLSFNDIVPVKRKKTSKSTLEKKEKHVSIKKDTPNGTTIHKSHTSSSRSKHNKVKTESPDLPDLLLQPAPTLNEVDILSTLPQTQPTYRPLPQRNYDCIIPSKKKVLSNEEAIKFTSSRREKTSVYSGRKNVFYTEVPTLLDSCIRVLIENIDAIEYMGGIVPYYILKQVLVRCSAQQLHNIEDYNPYLLEDTQELWEIHCKKDFRTHKPQENETWRDLYWRASEEREKKLRNITANISASMTTKYKPGRQVKMAYVDTFVKPPREVARKQAKHGTALPVNHPVKAGPPSKATPRPVAPVINSAASHSREIVPKKPKVAPLMAKTLKSMKQCFRR